MGDRATERRATQMKLQMPSQSAHAALSAHELLATDATPAHWRQCLSNGLANASASWIPRPTSFGVKAPSHYFACDQHPSYLPIEPSPLAPWSQAVSRIHSRMRGRKLIFLGESTMLQGYLAAACFLQAEVSTTSNGIVSEEAHLPERRFSNPLHFGCLALPPSPARPHAAARDHEPEPSSTNMPSITPSSAGGGTSPTPANGSSFAAIRSADAGLATFSSADAGQLCFVSLSVGPKLKSARRVGSGLADAYRLLARRGWLRGEDVLIASAGMRWNDQKEVRAQSIEPSGFE